MARKRIVPMVVLIVAAVVALASLSYPSLLITSSSTQTMASFTTNTMQYTNTYLQTSTSTTLVGYLTSIFWYPGNPVCDPMSNACSPYPSPTATVVYPESATYPYQVTLETQTTSTYTTQYTSFSTKVTSQNVPPYSAAGLSDLDFGVTALVVVAVVGLVCIFLAVGQRPATQSRTPQPAGDSPTFCERCGAANSGRDQYCTSCGNRLVHGSPRG